MWSLPHPTGSIVGQGLTDSMDVRKVGFTGSTGVGQTIMKSAALSNVKKVSLELGGKSPLIIFSDCDLDKAVRVVSNRTLLVMRPNAVYVTCIQISKSCFIFIGVWLVTYGTCIVAMSLILWSNSV